jgi:hypothetical protein
MSFENTGKPEQDVAAVRRAYARLMADYSALPERAQVQRGLRLEAAHVVGQAVFDLHCQVHVAMLRMAWQQRKLKEIVGQLMRMGLVPLGHLSGRLPLGNTGRSDVSAFKSMQPSAAVAWLIAAAYKAEREALDSPPPRADISCDNMLSVNRIVCFLLMLCMTLMSGGLHAHGTEHLSNAGYGHASHTSAPSAQTQTLDQANPTHDACLHAHCGNSHNVALAGVQHARPQIAGSQPAPRATITGFTSTPPDEIERPKWSFTTPRRGEFALT